MNELWLVVLFNELIYSVSVIKSIGVKLYQSFIVFFDICMICIDILCFITFISNLSLLSCQSCWRFVNLDEVTLKVASLVSFSLFSVSCISVLFYSPLLLVLGLFCSIILESWGASLGYWPNLIWDLLWLFPRAVAACIQYYKSCINTDMLYFHIHYYVFFKVSLRLLLWHMNYLYTYSLISKYLEIFLLSFWY